MLLLMAASTSSSEAQVRVVSFSVSPSNVKLRGGSMTISRHGIAMTTLFLIIWRIFCHTVARYQSKGILTAQFGLSKKHRWRWPLKRSDRTHAYVNPLCTYPHVASVILYYKAGENHGNIPRIFANMKWSKRNVKDIRKLHHNSVLQLHTFDLR